VTLAAERGAAAGLVLRALVPLGAGFFLGNYYRAVNAVLSPYLIADLKLDAGQLGLLTSVYFFTSAAFQLPLGLLMDRFGPRRVQGWLMLLAASGILMFALGGNLGVMALGRAIMGIGAAGALMTCFQAVVLWFPRARWPALNGWVMAAGGMGGLAASLPTALALHVTDWRGLMLFVAGASVAAAIAIFAAVPERERDAAGPGFAAQLRSLASIYRDRTFWRLGPVLATASGSNLAFGGLWAGPWLKDVAGLSPDGIGASLLVFTGLTIVGYVVSGNVAAWLERRGVSLVRVIGVSFLLSLMAQSPLLLPNGGGRWFVLCGIGAFSGIAALVYPVLNAHFPPGMSGRVNTAVNLFFFCGAFALQSAMGAVIGLYPQVAPGRYPPAAYQAAFALMFGVEFIAFLWFLVPARARRGAPAP
jgi:predicted MFS family arabinose efflux permease